MENRIQKWHPIPISTPPSPLLKEFLRGVLEENNKYVQIPDDKLLQQKVLNIMDSTSKILKKIEESTQCKTGRVEINLRELKEQSI